MSKKGPILRRQREEANRLFRETAVSFGVTVAAWWGLGFIPVVGPFLSTAAGLIGMGVTAYRGWKWLSYRGKWGLKF